MGYYLDRSPVEVDRSAMCYAESTDGIHWEKPNLRLYRYRGSTNATTRTELKIIRQSNNELLSRRYSCHDAGAVVHDAIDE